MSTKFEQLLDLIVNEEMDKANELFHEIVVEKSRDIYENLIAEEGSILFSSIQIKQNKPNELPTNIIIFATTSQIVESTSDGLRMIKNKYLKNYPTNITTIKYFEKVKEDDFLHYGSSAKNLYLLLLEDI